MKGVYKSVLVLVLSLVLLAVSFSCVAAADISVEDVSVSDVSVDIGGMLMLFLKLVKWLMMRLILWNQM